MRWVVLWGLLVGCAEDVDADGDGFLASEDCNDANPDIHPGAVERCDGVDADCDGVIDNPESLGPRTPRYYQDDDEDGFGAVALGASCDPIPGAVRVGGDCDDSNPDVRPGVPELCDAVDNDCDGLLDDDDEIADADLPIWYRDADGDQYGSAAEPIRRCNAPSGYVADGTDCDDSPDGADRNPGAPEICDGKDNNCDVATGLLVDDEDPNVDPTSALTWYTDQDGDGQGDPLTAVQSCSPPARGVDNGDDCDDRDRNNFVGNTEVCDGRDNDCDGLIDGDAWWDTAWPYRVMVGITAPPDATTAPPIAVDVDFAAVLAAQGDATAFDPDTVRVVLQQCGVADVEVPFELVDGLRNVLARGPSADPLGDGRAAVVWRWDTDGDLGTDEVLAAGHAATFGVYFGSAGRGPAVAPATFSSDVLVTRGGGGMPPVDLIQLDSGVSSVLLDGSVGGVADFLGLTGGPNVGGQAASGFGNGLYMGPPGGGPGAGWVTAASAPATALDVVHEGVLLATARGEGAASTDDGAYAWSYEYTVFAGRPEVYARVRFELVDDSHIGPQGTFWTAAVRPWQTDNLAFIGGDADVGDRDAAGFRWAWAAYDLDTYGAYVGYRVPPVEIGAPVYSANGRYIGLSGQDQDPSPVGNEVDLPAGTVIVDDLLVVVVPYDGARAGVVDEAEGLVVGVTATAGVGQAVP